VNRHRHLDDHDLLPFDADADVDGDDKLCNVQHHNHLPPLRMQPWQRGLVKLLHLKNPSLDYDLR
jgi:hypothetical protein